MAENVIHDYPGMYDKDMNTELYLMQEKEISQAQYNVIKENLGVYGPGRQVLIKDDNKYYLKSDEPADDAEARIKDELKEMSISYPS